MFALTRIQLIRLLHISGWLTFAIFSVAIRSSVTSVGLALLATVIAGVFLAITFYVNSQILVPRIFARGRYALYVLAAAGLSIVTAGLRSGLVEIIQAFHIDIFSVSSALNLPYGTYILAWLATFGVLVLSAFTKISQMRSDSERSLEQLAREKTEAQLDYLKAQINPHFLFNTLNNIYSLAYRKSDRAPEMILKLSHLLRYVLYDCREERVALGEDIAHNRLFIEVFQIKRTAPYPISFSEEITDPNLLIEPMLLIPLVENSLKHADLDHNPAAFVKIWVRNEGSQINFRIENTRDPADQVKDEVGGIGLSNVRKRLELNYPGKNRLEITEEPHRFRVDLQFEVS
ncbi:MAG: histidine kinase [Bacteroidota bacterium]